MWPLYKTNKQISTNKTERRSVDDAAVGRASSQAQGVLSLGTHSPKRELALFCWLILVVVVGFVFLVCVCFLRQGFLCEVLADLEVTL